MAGISGVGAGFFRFDLTSECKCGRQVNIRGYASTIAGGAGFKYTFSGSASSFYDYKDCPNEDIANGGFAMVAASSVFGGGGSCAKITLGNLYSDFSCSGPVYGLDLSAGVYLGASVVTDVSVTDCCEE